MAKKETVVFYHMPKAAGTTLNRMLKRHYRPEEFVECWPDTNAFVAEFKTWPEPKLKKIRLMQGHFPFGLHERLPQPTRCFTMLRDPVERVVSYYFHALRDPKHYLHEIIQRNQGSLKALLDSGMASSTMNNGQVRILSGVWEKPVFGAMDETMLAKAIENLRTCTVVGVTEEFDGTLLLLKHSFGWNHIFYTRANVGYNRLRVDQLSSETIDTIRRYNQLDQALYDEALRLFKHQCRTMSAIFPMHIAAFRLHQRLRRYSVRAYLKQIQAKLLPR